MRIFLLLILPILILEIGSKALTSFKKGKEYFDKVIALIETNYYLTDSIDFPVKSNRAGKVSFT